MENPKITNKFKDVLDKYTKNVYNLSPDALDFIQAFESLLKRYSCFSNDEVVFMIDNYVFNDLPE